ncbi:cell wall-binding protein [Limnochorda pilosa]|uniref:Cell wall-binding protein n=1 Tax=Limnochorda pilosa TaxID=1555112 RepID=A0A0K2SR37_LIMPI|nr:cell wall-binding protein [Limnochorda pilosa]
MQGTAPRCLPLTSQTTVTTRVAGKDAAATSVATAESGWPEPGIPELRAGVAIVVRGDGSHFQDALVASALMHHPRNGPILFTDPNNLDPIVAAELHRLSPRGVEIPMPDDQDRPVGVQVFLVGDLGRLIEQQVQRLGFRTLRLQGDDVFETAALVARLLGPPATLILASGETFVEALPAAAWSAHMGQPVLLTRRDQLPPPTTQTIQTAGNPNVYLVGSERTISAAVERTVRELTEGIVARISGATPAEISVELSRFRSPAGDFGWGITEPAGWGFRFSAVDAWQSAVAGNVFSHLEHHAPLLLVERDRIPGAVEEYIRSVNPRHPEPQPPFMHGFVVGPPEEVACAVQFRLEFLLRTVIE